jgi:hypothetical protein
LQNAAQAVFLQGGYFHGITFPTIMVIYRITIYDTFVKYSNTDG